MYNIFTKKVGPIGLDIGHHSIKMMQLALRGGHICVAAAMKAPLKAAGDAKERDEIIASTIKGMLEHGEFQGRTAVSCMANEQLKIKSVRVEHADEDAIEETLKGEVAARLGLEWGKSTIKYMVAGSVVQGSETRQELLVFAVDDEAIRNHIKLLEGAGLMLCGLDTVPCALFRSFERLLRRHQDKDVVNVFVDVGNQFTTVVVGRGRDISFVKQIPVGGERFNAEIAGKLGIEPAQAAMLRSKLSGNTETSGIDASTKQAVVDALSNATESLAKEISLCFRYFSVTFRGSRPSKAIFTGGEAYEMTLLSALRRQLGVEIEIAQPMRGFDMTSIDMGNEKNSELCEWAVAVGLALKGVNVEDGLITQYERN